MSHSDGTSLCQLMSPGRKIRKADQGYILMGRLESPEKSVLVNTVKIENNNAFQEDIFLKCLALLSLLEQGLHNIAHVLNGLNGSIIHTLHSKWQT